MSAVSLWRQRARALLSRCGQALAQFVATFAATLFGQINWQPPRWLSATQRLTSTAFIATRNTIKRRPRQSAAVIAAVVLLLTGGYLAWRWYESQPKPVEFQFTVETPAITCYACEPPGQPNPLIVRFSGSTAPLERSGHPIDPVKGGFTVSPAIAGQWFWDDDQTLRFQPAVDWPIDTAFTIKLDRKHFAAEHVHLRDYKVEFRTPAFAASLTNTEFYQDPSVAKNKKVVATITFTHPVDVASFERHVKLKMFDKVSDRIETELAEPQHTVVFDKLKLNAYIHSAELEIPPKAGRLQITVEDGVVAARGGNKTAAAIETSVLIPGLNSLSINNVALNIARDERNEPTQVLIIGTSFSVKEKDLPGKLTAWLLPVKHPDPKLQANFERYNQGKPFRWSNSTVKPDILASAQRLELQQIPGEREHYELHSFRYTADPGRQIYVTVQRGLQSFGGYNLGTTVERLLQVPEFPRELNILHQGSLLAMSGEKTLSLMSRNVPAIRVEIGRLLPRQLQHLVTQTGGEFSNPAFRNWAFDAANITERFTKIIKVAPAAPGVAQYDAVDLGEYLDKDASDRRGVFFLRVQAWDVDKNRPLTGYESQQWTPSDPGQLLDARLVVITDLGLVVKRSIDGTQDVFVQSLHTGRPVAGATVSIMGVNGLPVLTETSDNDGHVQFGDLKNLQREQRPVLYLAKLGGDSSFLPMDGRARSLDLSRFDVGGVESHPDPAALTAYLFSDRGIYRPGEQIRLASIIRSQDWSRRLTGVPLRLEVSDSRGVTIRRETLVAGAAGFNEILQDTKESSPTGTYTFSLSIIRDENRSDLIGSTTVQVREFLPDRLRMHVAFSAISAEGWVSPEQLQARIDLQNLFGTAAEDRRITAQLSLSPSVPAFRGFPDYQFHDPQLAKESFNERLPDSKTDDKGQAILDLNLQRFARATYRARVIAEGFEADGGRGVAGEASQLVSNMPYLIGYKPDGALDYIARDSAHSVDLIAIDSQAKRTAVEKLNVVRIEVRYVSVLMQQSNGTYKYESRRKETELTTQALTLPATGYQLTLDTTTPGNYAYLIRDADGLQLTRLDYQVAGDANVTRKLDKNAELELTLAKNDYSPGEEIEVSVRAPYAGAGLITIERDHVYAWHWFKASTTSSVQHIRVPDNLEGNAYVSVTFVRDPSSEEIYSSPLSYGVKPFSINLDARRNKITVDAPTRVKPGETLTLRYKTERPTRIVLFAVDEGILQVARYEAPDPNGYFFQKRSLGVNTMQILDLLLPEFRRQGLTPAAGGDGEGLLGQHLNPFRRKGDKPVAYWSGILDADSITREVKYLVPDYFNGSLRVMAVAVADERIGIHDSKVQVRGDFVLSPNAPTTVSPGDEFDVSVGISNNVDGSGAEAAVDITLATDRGLEIVGDAKQALKIGEGRESSVRFRLRARDALGAQNLMFSASTSAGNGGSAKRRIDLSLRPATPFMTQLTAGVVQGSNSTVPVQRDLYPQYRKLEAGISVLPLAFAHGFVGYLDNYPYACTEQIVSRAMPVIILGKRPEFGYVRTQSGADLAMLLSELRSRQNDAGAYKLWPGGDYVVEFVSLYAQHALLEASERGERIPGDIVLNGNAYLRSIAARDGNNLADERNSAYAIYLLTRQAINMSAEVAALRKRLEQRYKKEWPQDLTALWLAATLDLMKQDDEAAKLLRGVPFSANNDKSEMRDDYFDSMTHDALVLWITAKHFPERLPSLSPDVLTKMAKRVSNGWYNSLSAGTTLLALDAYATAAGSQVAKMSISELLADKSVRALTLPAGVLPKTEFSEQASSLRFGNESNLNAYYLMEQAGFDRKPPTTALKQGMEVLREYSDADGKPITQVTMGQEVTVRLKFRGLDGRAMSNIALVDLLPGGFELVVPQQAATQRYETASADGEESENEDADGGDSGGEDSAQSAEANFDAQCPICVGGEHASLQYTDMREDRAVFYASINDSVQEIVYRIKATNVGEFTTPPAYGEAMYDRMVKGRSAAGRIKVVRP